MTKEERSAHTSAKVNQIKELCILLKITMQAEQAVLDNGLIKSVIYYTDNEQYPTESTPEEVVSETTNEA